MLEGIKSLTNGGLLLWCYFLWYLVIIVARWDFDFGIYVRALGVCLLVGVALCANATLGGNVRLGPLQTLRFFLIPFCVSSYSSVASKNGFLFIFSPRLQENLAAAVPSALLIFAWVVLRWTQESTDGTKRTVKVDDEEGPDGRHKLK